MAQQTGSGAGREWHLFVPKLITVLRQGYGLGDLRHDALAGLTVAIVALPLAMALAIASGTTPERGLFTAIVAGFLISALGGSRFQIGGPTGAFVVVVFNVIERHGYDGLVLATLMAGVMLLFFGLFRLGTYIKYVPQPVVTGFTAGIAVIIFSSQIKDLLGLDIDKLPADFISQWGSYLSNLHSIDPVTVLIAAGTLAIILAVRRWQPKLPAFLIGIVIGTLVVLIAGLPVETIGSRFGEIPNMLPSPTLPEVTLERIRILFPDALTIALLAGIESLLSAVVADGMTGRRHRSNCELVAQGIANLGSAMFGGIPATGAIARTATNI
ncbi:MAG: sodium-independent anion transporter, partial [Alphaproteobacteria bacterium]|nr:sodium-independent anion transporter [Alphaproteobacteria bacterium]